MSGGKQLVRNVEVEVQVKYVYDAIARNVNILILFGSGHHGMMAVCNWVLNCILQYMNTYITYTVIQVRLQVLGFS